MNTFTYIDKRLIDLGQEQKAKLVHALNDKEKHIILKRHLHHTPSTLEVIGKDLNISKERVRQLESRAFLKLKKRILKTENKQDLI